MPLSGLVISEVCEGEMSEECMQLECCFKTPGSIFCLALCFAWVWRGYRCECVTWARAGSTQLKKENLYGYGTVHVKQLSPNNVCKTGEGHK